MSTLISPSPTWPTFKKSSHGGENASTSSPKPMNPLLPRNGGRYTSKNLLLSGSRPKRRPSTSRSQRSSTASFATRGRKRLAAIRCKRSDTNFRVVTHFEFRCLLEPYNLGGVTGIRQSKNRRQFQNESLPISAFSSDPGNFLIELALRPPRRGAFRPITAGFAYLRKYVSGPLW
jgi:hypothetical protein